MYEKYKNNGISVSFNCYPLDDKIIEQKKILIWVMIIYLNI